MKNNWVGLGANNNFTFKIKWYPAIFAIVILFCNIFSGTMISYGMESETSVRTEVSNGVLSIDSSEKYENMNSAYENGYEPTIDGNKVYLVIPLTVRSGEEIDNNTLTGSLTFENQENTSPFIIKSYEKEFKLTSNKTKSGKTKSIYLVTFSVKLVNNPTNGSYPIGVKLQYLIGGVEKQQEFSIYVNIKDGEEESSQVNENNVNSQNTGDITAESTETITTTGDLSSANATTGTSTESSQSGGEVPKLLITECTVTPNAPKPGEEVEINITLKNLSKKVALKNLKLTYASESGELLPTDTTGSLFLEEISADTTKVITFKMKSSEVVTSLNQKIILNAEYEDKNHIAYTGTESIYLQLAEIFSIYVDAPVLAANVSCGKKEKVKLKVFNTGKTTIKNVMFSIDVDGLTEAGTTFIGDIEPGSSAEGVATVVVTQKLLGEEGVSEGKKYGITSGSVLVKYNNVQGESFSEEKAVRTKILESTDETEADKKIEKSSQWSVSLVIGMFTIYVLSGAGFLFWKRRQP